MYILEALLAYAVPCVSKHSKVPANILAGAFQYIRRYLPIYSKGPSNVLQHNLACRLFQNIRRPLPIYWKVPTNILEGTYEYFGRPLPIYWKRPSNILDGTFQYILEAAIQMVL